MNSTQARLTWIAVSLFVLTLLITPVTSSIGGTYSPIFAVGADERIRFDVLALEWAGIVVVYAGLFFVFRRK
jgi:uncharacterized membrane protein